MLRFRPIAPKPIAGESFSGNFLSENLALNIKIRKKRKYVRKKTSGAASGRTNNKLKRVVTLQLLPEKSTGDEESTATLSSSSSVHDPNGSNVRDQITSFNFSDRDRMLVFSVNRNIKTQQTRRTDLTEYPKSVIQSWMTVDCTTGACMGGEKPGRTDIEIILNLEKDTCPSFISNGYNKVKWINEAYREMVIRHYGDGTINEHELFVSLTIKENASPYYMYSAFTCRVKVQYSYGKTRGANIMPCDTWRMECGDFAWKLDLSAALSLGR